MPLQLAYKQTVGVQPVIVYINLPLGQKASLSHKETFSDVEYPEVTANMVGSSTTPSRTKEKQPIVSSDKSDIEPEGVYQHIRSRTGIITPVDYNALVWGIEVSESHSAIMESQASNSSVEKEAFAYMAGILKKWPDALNSKPIFRGSNSI